MFYQTQETFRTKLVNLYPPDGEIDQARWHDILVAGAHYYGLTSTAPQGLEKHVARSIERHANKSSADRFLMVQFGIDMYTAHFAMNTHTHHNLRWIEISYADMVARYDRFAEQPAGLAILASLNGEVPVEE